LRVLPWTVNAPDEMQRLVDAGVDGILSNDPVLLGDELPA
jgi:glycerophosphoryl diester phosphodiesterase